MAGGSRPRLPSRHQGPDFGALPTKRPNEDAHTPSIIPLAPLTGEGRVARHTFQTPISLLFPRKQSRRWRAQSTLRRLACGQDLGRQPLLAAGSVLRARRDSPPTDEESLLPGLFGGPPDAWREPLVRVSDDGDPPTPPMRGPL
ncbi:hypothetical protein IscW_ISCW000942 [Ixodes scapularis]|uniref:Uncharacterized protein n=1 Tax=Ixodes scapularis TaxID=6945 RepID=B7P6G1_IXOSC|nr:hypothetical protein IscW_ISCW000942 [Ixodes scapularis]|eukprot:XP_002408691.1 hypothetical protein IscW_ISCW000942 [Ixodes scapularis]